MHPFNPSEEIIRRVFEEGFFVQDIVIHDWTAIVRITSDLDKIFKRIGNL